MAILDARSWPEAAAQVLNYWQAATLSCPGLVDTFKCTR